MASPTQTEEEKLSHELLSFQANVVRLRRYKEQYDKKGLIDDIKNISDESARIKTAHIELKLGGDHKVGTKASASLLDTKDGGATDAKLTMEQIATLNTEITSYQTDVEALAAKFDTEKKAIVDNMGKNIDKVLSPAAKGEFSLVSAKEWIDATKATETLKEIDRIKEKLTTNIKALGTTPADETKRTLLTKQIENLDKFKKEINEVTDKLASEILEKIKKEVTLQEIQISTTEKIKSSTIDQMAIDLDIARRSKKVYLSTENGDPVTLGENESEEERKLLIGKFRVGNCLQTEFLASKESVGWTSSTFGQEKEIKDAFDLFKAKFPGTNVLYLTVGKDVSPDYIKKMVAEAKTQGVTLMLSNSCRDKLESRAAAVEKLLSHEIKDTANLSIGGSGKQDTTPLPGPKVSLGGGGQP